MNLATSIDFSARLIAWQQRHGRHDLPWQNSADPYLVWVSEIMLQQTQVAAVIPYYQRFIARFPDIASLAQADQDAVLTLWSGLGYYSRARNLHQAARLMVERHAGRFPRQFDHILALPGIGRSTAAAISAFAFGECRAILDGNVKRVLARCFGVAGYPGAKPVEAALWQLAEQLLPQRNIKTYTQALMDLGATVCKRNPNCLHCPVANLCRAKRENRIGELPAPKPRKPVPEKRTTMLLLLAGGEVLLEKRPPAGVWGGLWSFPELPPEIAPVAFCRERFGVVAEAAESWPILSHTFTHFRLCITPQPIAVKRRNLRITQPGVAWLGLQDALGTAIPVPVRTLLRQLIERAG